MDGVHIKRGQKSKPAGRTLAPARDTYRHGDLRRALLDAGIALARQGGPEAVVLREATRRAGVVPNAAYRHFPNRDALLGAVRAAAIAEFARAIEAEFARVPAGPPDRVARGQLRAVGVAYLRFAHEQTGLFRTAFADGPAASPPDPARAGASGLSPFQLLGAALDAMVAAGVLAKAQRPDAEYLAWSSVHGLAMLTLNGPLRSRSRAELEALGARVIDMAENGLAAARRPARPDSGTGARPRRGRAG
ncbi:MAG: TetR/AcrR family transcriptional regulator [Alphaproteobacteria bacterium]|nr:TetR/AcrR family transcriptional regulator [Alphaproteobacteria bacterium]